nr:glycosyltransferase [Entomobacter blattae]
MICSGGRYESQANRQVRESIMDGWAAIVGEDNVIAINITGAAAAVETIRPTVVFAIGSYLPESIYFGEICRKAHAIGAVTVFWATEDPYEQDACYRITDDFDVIFSCDKWGTNFYDHPHAYHLALGASKKLHYVPINTTIEKNIDVFFCGVAFTNRKDIVRNLLPILRNLNIRIIGPGWGEFGIGFSDARIDKEQVIELYQRSKIVLNLGRSLHFENKRFMIMPSSPGPRTFEAALAGAMQIFYEDTFEIHTYYQKDEIPTFSNAHDFEKILERFLDNNSLILQTAQKAQDRTLKDHTYEKRIQNVMEVLRTHNFLKS